MRLHWNGQEEKNKINQINEWTSRLDSILIDEKQQQQQIHFIQQNINTYYVSSLSIFIFMSFHWRKMLIHNKGYWVFGVYSGMRWKEKKKKKEQKVRKRKRKKQRAFLLLSQKLNYNQNWDSIISDPKEANQFERAGVNQLGKFHLLNWINCNFNFNSLSATIKWTIIYFYTHSDKNGRLRNDLISILLLNIVTGFILTDKSNDNHCSTKHNKKIFFLFIRINTILTHIFAYCK